MSRSYKQLALSSGLIFLLISAAWGDSLQLKNGSLIKGKYLGGTETEVAFQVGSTVQRYAVADVESISFDAANRPSVPAAAAPTPQPQAVPHPAPSATTAPATAPSTPPPTANAAPQLAPRPVQPSTTAPATTTGARIVNVPTGTRMMIRMIDAVDSDRNQIGDSFKASLDQPLVVNDVTVVPKGADVYGRLTQAKQAGQIQGRSELRLELTSIVVNGQTIGLTTGDYSVSGSSRGESTAKRVGGAAALGAIIGAVAGGGKGAAVGATVGAGAGTAVQVMTKGEQVHVPSETLLEFTIQQDVRIPVANNAAGASK